MLGCYVVSDNMRVSTPVIVTNPLLITPELAGAAVSSSNPLPMVE